MKKLCVFLIIAILMMFMVNVSLMNVVHAHESVDFKILKVVWGTPQNNPIIVYPGDTNVPLTIYVKNNSSESLVGVYGELNVLNHLNILKTTTILLEPMLRPLKVVAF